MNILISSIDSGFTGNIVSTLNVLQPEWKVLLVGLGRECLNIIQNEDNSDVIIIDTKMTDMSGFELTGRIRDNSDIPILFISKRKNIKTLIKALDSGADDYMVFPFNKAILIARLKALIRRRNWDIQTNEKRGGKAVNHI